MNIELPECRCWERAACICESRQAGRVWIRMRCPLICGAKICDRLLWLMTRKIMSLVPETLNVLMSPNRNRLSMAQRQIVLCNYLSSLVCHI